MPQTATETPSVAPAAVPARSLAKVHVAPAPKSGTVADSPAQEVVAQKFSRFVTARRDLLRKIAAGKGRTIPAEIDRFFEVLESGDWNLIQERFKAMDKREDGKEGGPHDPELFPFWATVRDAYGVAEQVHKWPPQQLLDYGKSVLESLKPGTIYFGGTDSGRWIPELLDESSGSERRIILTQNALADLTYLDFVGQLYGEHFKGLASDEQSRAFQEYMADVQRRYAHDRDFPDEPPQLFRGEKVEVSPDGRTSVSGEVSVMEINNRLVKALMAKNPDRPVAIQESIPLRDTYGDALPKGPIMEIGSAEGKSFTTALATESLEYWKGVSTRLLSDPEAAGSATALDAYAHDAVSTANVMAAREFPREAESTYRVAAQISPENPRPVAGLMDLMVKLGRVDEAMRLRDEYLLRQPGKRADLEKLSSSAVGLKSP